jgi:hypothetical protein
MVVAGNGVVGVVRGRHGIYSIGRLSSAARATEYLALIYNPAAIPLAPFPGGEPHV